MSTDRYGLRNLDLERLRAKEGVKWAGPGQPFAAWVADMDFPVAPAIRERLRDLIDRDEFGYPDWGYPPRWTPAARHFPVRMAERFGWTPDLDRVYDLDDVIQGVRTSMHLVSEPGEAFVLHLPAYHPFLDTSVTMQRPIIEVASHRTATGFDFDYDRLGADLATHQARVWVLCHPHNPLGHVFDRIELEQIAQIALRHDLVVISDEVHADIGFTEVPHVPFASLSDEVAARTVTVTSASKAFNLAGLRWAVMHTGYQPLADALASFPDHFFGAANRMGVAAALVAWTEGDDWLRAVLAVIDENRHSLTDLLATHLPGAVYHPPDATYLAWVDVSGCGLDGDPIEVFRSRGVELSPGPAYGADGAGHVRINLATSPDILAATIARLGSI